MCFTPACQANLPVFKLSGAVGMPPASGWKIKSLPEDASGLQAAWTGHAGNPDNARAAWLEMMQFLAHNGLSSTSITESVIAIGIDQWCSPDPSRCDRKWRRPKEMKVEPRFFPWAKSAWESLNNALADDTPDGSLPGIMENQIASLTTLIDPASPTGCAHCHAHWLQVLAANPLPDPLTLDAARHWVVRIHNETREGREPVPYEEIAVKFHWSDPAPASE